jgi:hypothetical protein
VNDLVRVEDNEMSTLSRRQFLQRSGAFLGAAMAVSRTASPRTVTAAPELVPRKFPFPPNDQYGNYEPTITGDGNTIYFARFANTGDPRVKVTDLFVTHRIRRTGEWPGSDGDWTVPERLPDTVNSDAIDLEPRISRDGNTLYFMSTRAGGRGATDIYVSRKLPGGEWTRAENLGPTVNSPHVDHCFMPSGIPGEEDTSAFISIRPREPGAAPSPDVYTTRWERGIWQPPRRVPSKVLDSIGFKCRVNAVAKDGLVLGVVSVHDFGKFHRMVFVHYDPATGQWRGPVVDAPFNAPNVDGACPMFTADGDRMIWSSGQHRGPGAISSADGTGGVYDLFWLKTSDIVAYYRARAGLRA